MRDLHRIGPAVARAVEETRQARHARMFAENMAVMESAPVAFERREFALLFRDAGKPRCDFYPHTGRWRVVGQSGQTYRGGARAFLAWYARQSAKQEVSR